MRFFGPAYCSLYENTGQEPEPPILALCARSFRRPVQSTSPENDSEPSQAWEALDKEMWSGPRHPQLQPVHCA